MKESDRLWKKHCSIERRQIYGHYNAEHCFVVGSFAFYMMIQCSRFVALSISLLLIYLLRLWFFMQKFLPKLFFHDCFFSSWLLWSSCHIIICDRCWFAQTTYFWGTQKTLTQLCWSWTHPILRTGRWNGLNLHSILLPNIKKI